MSGVSGVSWYDLLGVSPEATPDQIKTAWRAATDKFEPGSGTGQFRLFNEAADVLLDPAQRASYDAELGHSDGAAEDDSGVAAVILEPTPEPVPAVVLEKAPAPADVAEPGPPTQAVPPNALRREVEPSGDAPSGTRSGKPVPAWLMAIVAVLSVVALVLGGVFWTKHRQHVQQQDGSQEASAAAERALPVVLSYDYRQLSADRDKAARFLSAKYEKEYVATFNKLIESTGGNPGPAEQTKAVVKASIVNIGVVDAEPGVAKVIVFLNQATVKAGGTPKFSLNRLTVSMVKSGNSWLVDDINSY